MDKMGGKGFASTHVHCAVQPVQPASYKSANLEPLSNQFNQTLGGMYISVSIYSDKLCTNHF